MWHFGDIQTRTMSVVDFSSSKWYCDCESHVKLRTSLPNFFSDIPFSSYKARSYKQLKVISDLIKFEIKL